ncbi:lysoplasmalogenase [Acrasis kona]|uniref:Lysoplasmalogenase n=1 Tax=Acrasis kona TaxID=1008807 RepID=A0AAW2ZGR7_9EUKA
MLNQIYTSWVILFICLAVLLVSNSPIGGEYYSGLLSKFACSVTFMVIAFVRNNSINNSNKDYGKYIVIGLFFSLVGDVLLAAGDSDALFMGGIAAFMLTHFLYIVAFLYLLRVHHRHNTAKYTPMLYVAILVLTSSYFIGYKIIIQQIPDTFLPLSYPYMCIISVMVALSPAGNLLSKPISLQQIKSNIKNATRDLVGYRGDAQFTEGQKAWLRLIGSIMFYLSDLCVARQAFIQKSFYNKLIGLPLYYFAQMIIASSI